MASGEAPCWFENWFDSEYYHLLYQDRDQAEAERFIRNLIRFLPILPGESVLDLACGKGRHSVFLHSLGFRVLGVDLSENSISWARKSESEGLRFRVGDMREPQGVGEFDLVLNLFTSFGYFESEAGNLQTLESIRTSLKPGGKLVVDFFNTQKVIDYLVPYAEVEKGGIRFFIRKFIENQIIRKEIRFQDKQKDWFFEERVQAISQSDFLRYFEKTGFEVVHLSGDYDLKPYSEKDSERMIFFVRKAE